MSGISRRTFLAATTTSMALGPTALSEAARVSHHCLPTPPDGDLRGRIYKSLKVGMIQVAGNLTDKFRAAKSSGFRGVEMDSPGMNVDETRAAITDSGLVVDGTVCSTHWQVRHTSPDPRQRAQALEDLKTALYDTHAVGGHTTLLVVGHGQDGPEREIWGRAIDNISQALPLAAELGVYIAIENVWNRFLYDHDGNQQQTADKFLRFVDEFNSPWVGMQFDIGNHWKYGAMGDWIRLLGRRIVKLDVKGFSRAKNEFTSIGQGDIDWADVRAALTEIKYTGWAAAEVTGGDESVLKEISHQMDDVFQLA